MLLSSNVIPRTVSANVTDEVPEISPVREPYIYGSRNSEISIYLKPDATAAQREAAYSFNLLCMDEFRGLPDEDSTSAEANVGPKEQQGLLVLGLVPFKDLSRLYGPLWITKAEFVMNGGGKCAGCSFADLRWWINADQVDTQRADNYRTIQPSHGKINCISTLRNLLQQSRNTLLRLTT